MNEVYHKVMNRFKLTKMVLSIKNGNTSYTVCLWKFFSSCFIDGIVNFIFSFETCFWGSAWWLIWSTFKPYSYQGANLSSHFISLQKFRNRVYTNHSISPSREWTGWTLQSYLGSNASQVSEGEPKRLGSTHPQSVICV